MGTLKQEQEHDVIWMEDTRISDAHHRVIPSSPVEPGTRGHRRGLCRDPGNDIGQWFSEGGLGRVSDALSRDPAGQNIFIIIQTQCLALSLSFSYECEVVFSRGNMTSNITKIEYRSGCEASCLLLSQPLKKFAEL